MADKSPSLVVKFEASLKGLLDGIKGATQAAEGYQRSIEDLSGGLRNAAREERTEGRIGSYVAEQLTKFIPITKDASRAVGELVSGFAFGGAAGLGFKALEVGAEHLWKWLDESNREAAELNKQKLEGFKKAVDDIAASAEAAENKLKAMHGVDLQGEKNSLSKGGLLGEQAALREKIEGRWERAYGKESVQDSEGNWVKQRRSAESILAQGSSWAPGRATAEEVEQWNALNNSIAAAIDKTAKYKTNIAEIHKEENSRSADQAQQEADKRDLDEAREYSRTRQAILTEAETAGVTERRKLNVWYTDQLKTLHENDTEARLALEQTYLTRLGILEDSYQAKATQKAKDFAARVRAAMDAEIQKQGALAEGRVRLATQEATESASAASAAIGNTINVLTNSIATGQVNAANVIRDVWGSLVGTIGSALQRILQKKIETAMVEKAVDAAATTASVTNSAARAGAETAAGYAGIPFIGPAVAVAAGLVMLAAIQAAFKVSSARGGYDISAGENPLTQLHEKEMVLPAELADRVRDMTGSGKTEVHHHWNGVWDGGSVQRLIESDTFRRANREAKRNGRA